MDLTNEQWQRIREFFPKPKGGPGKSGRAPQDLRAVKAIHHRNLHTMPLHRNLPRTIQHAQQYLRFLHQLTIAIDSKLWYTPPADG
jgi:hypothetical protein